MKFRNIFIASLSAVALASCSDFLEVDAPSKNEMGYVFSDKTRSEEHTSELQSPR